MKMRLSPKAEADLEAIADWIAKDDPGAAWRFTEALRAECQSWEVMAERHPISSQRPGEVDHRKAFGQYLIFYPRMSGTIEILRIIQGAQDCSRNGE